MTTTDFAGAYRGSRKRLSALARELGDEGAQRMVPASPAWRIHDVIGHLTGLVADVAALNLEGLGTDEWTAKQVDARRDRSIDEVVAEWDEIGPGMEELLPLIDEAQALSVVGDIAAHEMDVWGALGRAEARDADSVHLGFVRYRNALADRVAAAGLAPLDVSLLAPQYELFRAMTGRRSADQLRGYDWGAVDPEPYIPIFSAYGMATEPLVE
jgi:hypothetical protein